MSGAINVDRCIALHPWSAMEWQQVPGPSSGHRLPEPEGTPMAVASRTCVCGDLWRRRQARRTQLCATAKDGNGDICTVARRSNLLLRRIHPGPLIIFVLHSETFPLHAHCWRSEREVRERLSSHTGHRCTSRSSLESLGRA